MKTFAGILLAICMIAASVWQAGMAAAHAGVPLEAPDAHATLHAGHHASHDAGPPCHMTAPASGHALQHADASCPAWHACAGLDGVPETRAIARRVVLGFATRPRVDRWRAGVAPALETPPQKA
jgi:hypothetical protein